MNRIPDHSPRERIIELLVYIRELEKLKKSAPFKVPEDLFCRYQSALFGLPGVGYDLVQEGDDVWMRVARLQEVAPPDPGGELSPWLTLHKAPDKRPELRAEILVGKGAEQRRIAREDVPGLLESFSRYVEELWEPWSAAEKPRRQTIWIYNRLFALHQAMSGDNAERPVDLVWGIGLALWRHACGRVIQHPLLTQSCEISLNTHTFDLDIRPRNAECLLELDCYAELEIGAVSEVEAFFKAQQANAASRPSPFDGSSVEDLLSFAAGHLDAGGRFLRLGAEGKLPAPSETLTVTDAWVLYGRPRSSHILLDDIERLKKHLEDPSVQIPAALVKFVTPGDPEVRPRIPVAFRGLSASATAADAQDLFFPLPHNEEQKRIVELLETGEGVVVQGPPGTGKTHTIANVICHFLAQGKRVLVTARSEQALTVLRDKIPENVRALTVALLSSEREGMKQFEHSISRIGSEVAQLDPAQKEREITQLEVRLNQLHAQIAALDHDIGRIADRHLAQVRFSDQDMLPEKVARMVLEQAELHGWLTDRVPAGAEPAFSNDDFSELRRARRDVGRDIVYLGGRLPLADSLPAEADLLALHRDLMQARAIDHRVESGQLLALADTTPDTFDRAKVLLDDLKQAQSLQAKIRSAGHSWSFSLRDRLRTHGDPLIDNLLNVAEQLRTEDHDRRKRLARPVDMPAGVELDDDVRAALRRLVDGRNAFNLPFGHKEARRHIAAMTVAGLKPAATEDWQALLVELEHRLRARKILAAWNAAAAEVGIDGVESSGVEAFRWAVRLAEHVEDLRQLAREVERSVESGRVRVFGRSASEMLLGQNDDAALATAIESLAQHIDKGRLAYSRGRVRDLLESLEPMRGPVVEDLRGLLQCELGNSSVEEVSLAGRWRSLKSELKRLAGLAEPFASIERVTGLVERSGAPQWATRLRTEPAQEGDPLAPANWLEAFRWRAARTLLESLDAHDVLRRVFERRQTAESDLAQTYRALVAAMTWLGVYNNSPGEVRQALAAYLTAIQAIGAGTGVRAIRHRRDARAAMMRAHRAVPCWIMPEWRVAETLPAEVGKFDLIVVDEASQADMWALPALLRAKKLLIVGDHKQVSPSAVGIAEQKINDIKARFLSNQPNGALMTPDRSIYDLAKVVFADSFVTLKEHFRSVPAIIEFSSHRFYNGEIKPLRVPKRTERLDPPLIDVFVRGGHRRRDINEPEARAIVAEIEAIIEDMRFAGRSIGVVTLLGNAQAPFIDRLIHHHIEPQKIVEHRIRVGNPTVFQGDERDIMLMSMVLAPGERGVPNRMEFQQRFNVAASRARDRMYLFRSIEESDVTAEGLNAQLIAHFRQPFKHDAYAVSELRKLCQSDFEREMFDLLVERDYRVRPQMPVGGYHIDFVVEGNEDRRLAIECDGDRWHGPGQWHSDMLRQRVLERAGWTFWRCFGSSFVLHREQVLDDLWATLDRMGIEPLGSETADSTVWVSHKIVDADGAEVTDDETGDASRGGGEENEEDSDDNQRAEELRLV